MLTVARGGTASIADVFTAIRQVVPGFVVYLAVSIINWLLIGLAVGIFALLGGFGPNAGDEMFLVFIGCCFLLMIPGYIIWLALSQSFPLILDRDMGAVEAMKKSIEVTAGNRISLFVIMLLGGLMLMAGYMCCFLPLIFIAPYISMLYAVAYLQMTGQAVAA